MIKPPIPDNENERLHALTELNILDTPIQESFERITRLAKSLFKVPIVAFSLVDNERQWFKSIQGLDICETSREVSFCGHTICQDELLIVNDSVKDARFADNPLVTGEPHIRFYAGYPVRAADKYKIGSLCLIDTVPREFSPEELAGLRDLVALIEAEIAANKINYYQFKLINELDRAKKSAQIDSVTRLWNRKSIEDLLMSRANLAVEQHEIFGVAIIDIDNFKNINDTYGHCAGDSVLQNVAKRLLTGYRDKDIVGRWGGEEFLAIISTDTVESLFEIADRSRKLIADEVFVYQDKQIPVTVTTGVAIFDWHKPEDTLSLVSRADKALYKGKHVGKNIVVQAEEKT